MKMPAVIRNFWNEHIRHKANTTAVEQPSNASAAVTATPSVIDAIYDGPVKDSRADDQGRYLLASTPYSGPLGRTGETKRFLSPASLDGRFYPNQVFKSRAVIEEVVEAGAPVIDAKLIADTQSGGVIQARLPDPQMLAHRVTFHSTAAVAGPHRDPFSERQDVKGPVYIRHHDGTEQRGDGTVEWDDHSGLKLHTQSVYETVRPDGQIFVNGAQSNLSIDPKGQVILRRESEYRAGSSHPVQYDRVEEQPGGILLVHAGHGNETYVFKLPVTVEDVHGQSLEALQKAHNTSAPPPSSREDY
jgi:hypothetical protein